MAVQIEFLVRAGATPTALGFFVEAKQIRSSLAKISQLAVDPTVLQIARLAPSRDIVQSRVGYALLKLCQDRLVGVWEVGPRATQDLQLNCSLACHRRGWIGNPLFQQPLGLGKRSVGDQRLDICFSRRRRWFDRTPQSNGR